MTFLAWLNARAREPSSYLGLAAFATAFAIAPQIHDLQTFVMAIGLGLGGVGAFVAKEHLGAP